MEKIKSFIIKSGKRFKVSAGQHYSLWTGFAVVFILLGTIHFLEEDSIVAYVFATAASMILLWWTIFTVGGHLAIDTKSTISLVVSTIALAVGYAILDVTISRYFLMEYHKIHIVYKAVCYITIVATVLYFRAARYLSH